jgi:hypothetical protein
VTPKIATGDKKVKTGNKPRATAYLPSWDIWYCCINVGILDTYLRDKKKMREFDTTRTYAVEE